MKIAVCFFHNFFDVLHASGSKCSRILEGLLDGFFSAYYEHCVFKSLLPQRFDRRFRCGCCCMEVGFEPMNDVLERFILFAERFGFGGARGICPDIVEDSQDGKQ